MKAYDLVFGDPPGAGSYHPDRDQPAAAHGLTRAGWIGGPSAGIPQASWPRSPLTGLPMLHVLTMRLPVEYQRRGPGLPGIAFFAGEGQFAEAGAREAGDPFVAQLEAAQVHPQFRLLTDVIDGQWGLLWLTEQELAGRTAPPEDLRREGEHADTSEGVNAWDQLVPEQPLWLAERHDPNAGITPAEPDAGSAVDGPDGRYQSPFTTSWGSHPWAVELHGRSHLGGTTFHVQGLPEGLTPFYLELEEFGLLNFGGGNAQIDLQSDTFDWSCG